MSGKKAIGFYTAVSIVISSMIGVGIFTSLGYQVADIKSGFSILFLWILGGIASLLGALCYGELGAALPRSGGEYNYLSRIYHPSVGFLSGWISATVGFAAPSAASSMALGKYFSGVFPSLQPIWIAVAVIFMVTVVHTLRISIGRNFQNIFTGINIVAIVVIITGGLFSGRTGDAVFSLGDTFFSDIGNPAFAVSFFFVSLAYSGWNASAYIAGEMEEPRKNLPRSLIAGTLFVMVLYILITFVFLYTTPIGEMAGKAEVGLISSKHILGDAGGQIMGIVISLLLLSSVSAMTLAGPRVTSEIGKDFSFFTFFSRTNKNNIPVFAIILQGCISLFFIFTARFEQVITYISFTLNLFLFLTVLGLIVLRIKEPGLPRPYRTWGYPFTPVVFLIISAWLIYFGFKEKPYESLAGFGTALLGLIFYFMGRKRNTTAAAFLAVLFVSCSAPEIGNKTQADADTINKDTIVVEPPGTVQKPVVCREYDDLARYIAGLPRDTGSTLDTTLENITAWKRFSQDFDKKWKTLDSSRFEVMNRWQQEELAELTDSVKTVFYPFAGPDFLNVIKFYPNAEKFVLVGLEPVGSLPNYQDTIIPDSVSIYFSSIEKSLHAILNFSFFRTNSMAIDLTQKELDGTIHLILLFLERTGHKIVDINPVDIDPNGELIKYSSMKEVRPDSLKNKGVEIDFIGEDSIVKKVFYYSVNLHNEYLRENEGFLTFVDSLGAFNTYLKSASYLMHRPYFSIIRDFILSQSHSVLEDDSAIPYKFFTKDNDWDISLYGTYSTISMFNDFHQEDMKQAYKDTSLVKELPFGIGYKYKKGESNLLLAKKRRNDAEIN